MTIERMYYRESGSQNVLDDAELDSAQLYTFANDQWETRSYPFLTLEWDYTYAAATALVFTVEGTMDGTNWTDITETLVQLGADAIETYNPTWPTNSGDGSGSFSVPMGPYRQVRVTITGSGSPTTSDLITVRACAHDR